jgi:hypothetical protein
MMQAAAKGASSVQRSTFFRMLRMKDCLPLKDEKEKLSDGVIARVKDEIGREADNLMEKNASLLPADCERAPAHLQMAALALSAQRTLLRTAAAGDEFKMVDNYEVRWVVAGALGVVAPPDGAEPWAVPVNYVPNRLSMVITGSIWLPQQRKSMVTRMLANWRIDLGKAFETEPIEPEPSCRMTKCLYTDFLHQAGGEHAEVLIPVFHQLHSATFKGVHNFTSSEEPGPDGTPMPVFRFG